MPVAMIEAQSNNIILGHGNTFSTHMNSNIIVHGHIIINKLKEYDVEYFDLLHLIKYLLMRVLALVKVGIISASLTFFLLPYHFKSSKIKNKCSNCNGLKGLSVKQMIIRYIIYNRE